jgi:hypothetical protein
MAVGSSGNSTIIIQNGSQETTQTTGQQIDFTAPKIFNTASSPGTSAFSGDLSVAKLGIVQKIFSQSAAPPIFPPSWVLVGEGIYDLQELNVIFAEFCGGIRVEFSIIQIYNNIPAA